MTPQQKRTTNDGEEFSGLDPYPIRLATITEVGNRSADAHGKVHAGDHEYDEGHLFTAQRISQPDSARQ